MQACMGKCFAATRTNGNPTAYHTTPLLTSPSL